MLGSVFVGGLGGDARLVGPTEGRFRGALLDEALTSSNVQIDWIPARAAPAGSAASMRNIELRFFSSRSGACSVEVDFQPTALGEQQGLGPARTTIVLQ